MKTYMKTILRTVLLAVLPVIASCKAGGSGPAGKTSVADVEHFVDGLAHFTENADMTMIPDGCSRHLKTVVGKVQKLDSRYIDMSEDEWEKTIARIIRSISKSTSNISDFAAVQIIVNHLLALDDSFYSVQYNRRLEQMRAILEQMESDTLPGDTMRNFEMNLTVTSDRTLNGVVVESDTLRYSSGE
ncbi:MAG: hypothetical protein MJY58_00905 [Bacteroidaceae bacterium]|nr:hypothetical protein [Bacteroidaceae bacterium]